MTIQWTARAQNDLAAISAFVEIDSPHYSSVIVQRLLRAVDRLRDFPQSGRMVPEYNDPTIREIIAVPYRLVYRLVNVGEIHMLTVHHGARGGLGDL